jgi:hypothetical protein
MEPIETESVHRHPTGHSWLDLVLGVSAIAVSVISLILGIHNGRAMERVVEANSWPFVETFFSTSNPDSTPHAQLIIANKGVGPATIESMDVIVDGKAVASPRALLNSLLKRVTTPGHPRVLQSDVVHTVVAAREQMSFVDFSPVSDYTPEEYAVIADRLSKVRIVTCYCSVFEECWVTDTYQQRPSKVKRCPSSNFSSG